jgi:hypothetical protein
VTAFGQAGLGAAKAIAPAGQAGLGKAASGLSTGSKSTVERCEFQPSLLDTRC